MTSSAGYSLFFDNLNNRIRPSAGQRFVFSQDFAGLGGSVRYLKTTVSGAKYFNIGSGFIFSTSAEGGFIKSFEKRADPFNDPVRLTDRFYLGEPQIRGFDIRGVGPRVLRTQLDANGNPIPVTNQNEIRDEAIGGRAYYLARFELEVPLSSGLRELGLRPSFFVDAGAVFGVRAPREETYKLGDSRLDRPTCLAAGVPVGTPGVGGCPTGTTPGTAAIAEPFQERFFGDSPSPRVSVGFGVNWNSPFGPFRIDIAKALLKQPGDRTKLFTFNVGTQF